MPVKPSLAFLGLRCRLLRWRLRRLGRFGRLGRLRCRLLQALLHWLRLSGLRLLARCRLLPIPVALLLGRDLVRALLLSLLPYLPFNLLALLPLLLLHSAFFRTKESSSGLLLGFSSFLGFSFGLVFANGGLILHEIDLAPLSRT